MEFFRGLARHNTREWFQPRKEIFEQQVKQPMRELVEAVNAGLQRFAPEYVTDPDKAIYRFYRDTRFSKDKTPYKDHIAASFPRRGMARHQGAGYYFGVSHKELAIGGGMYMPMPETLLAVRNAIAGRHDELRKIVTARAATRLYGELQGDSLARVPKGFLSTHPAADLLKRKQFLFYVELEPELALSAEVVGTIRKHFQALGPLIEFLNAPLAGKGRQAKPAPSGI